MPDNECFNLEEGMARLAFADGFAAEAHHPIQPGEDVEMLSIDGEDLYADTGGRWAQTCDWYKDKEAGIAPCLCRWLNLAARAVVSSLAFPAGSGQSGDAMELPTAFNCPKDASTGQYNCRLAKHIMHPMSIPALAWSSHVRPSRSFFSESALVRDSNAWWNWEHVLTKSEKESFEAEYGDLYASKDLQRECENERTCWIKRHFEEEGRLLVVVRDCAALAGEACYLQRMLNLTGIFFECNSSAPARLADRSALDQRLYQGQWDRFDPEEDFMEEFITAMDFHDTSRSKLKVTVMFNDTTELLGGGGGPRIIPRGLSSGINDAFDAYVNAREGTAAGERRVLGAMGLKEMPKPANFLSLDLGSLIGPFFFTLAFSMLFPTMVVALVYEKEVRLRVMMRMMGLGTSAYWLINYLFWLIIYALFVLVFVAIGSSVALPSGYTIGLFTKNAGSVHFVLFFGFINNTIALAFLWATLIRSARVAQVSSILFTLTMAMIAWAAWDSGNFYNSDTVSKHTKNFITVFPFWNFYRGWAEYREYAFQAVYLGVPGLGWSQISDDPRCGMDAVLVSLYVEWPLFLLLALYLDQVRDSGNGVPQHPLFFLGKVYETKVNQNDAEVEGGAGDDLQDVRAEAERVQAMAQGAANQRDAVMIEGLNKVYPARMGAPQKVAVKTLTMGVGHGECFGMLGPNGAGKTTTINMLTGFAQPTAGTALVENLDIRTEMTKIYTLMGVCPQHDILWDTLTARQHMLFYGRLKNLAGEALKQAVVQGLKQVNLLHVMDQKAMTFSGGMKRRLSVAISMIGAPLVCYLDEPSTGLDPASRRTLWGVIKEAKKSRAIFLTTHSMEEAEGLCDRLGIFVDGELRCVGSPKALTQKFGGFYVLTIHSDPAKERQVSDMVHSMARDVRITYGLAGTQKFEIPADQITLSQVFRTMTQHEQGLGIKDWGIANTTLEEAFIKISKGAIGT